MVALDQHPDFINYKNLRYWRLCGSNIHIDIHEPIRQTNSEANF